MTKAPYLLTGLACSFLVCLFVGERTNRLREENAELTRQNSQLLNQTRNSFSESPSQEKTRNLRKKRPRFITVNYSYLEQGLQVSLPKLYGDYIAGLNLSAYESRYFKSLLVERLIAQQQFGLEMIIGDRKERLVSTQTIERRITDNNQNIRKFLNHRLQRDPTT